MAGACVLLVLSLLTGTIGAMVSSSRPPKASPMVSLEGLAVEIRDCIFERLDPDDYAHFLRTSATAVAGGASQYLFLRMIEQSAEELDSLDPRFFGEGERALKILSRLCTFARSYARLSTDHRELHATDDVEQSYTELAVHSSTILWRGTCMFALTDGGLLRPLPARLVESETFLRANISPLLFAAVLSEDMARLENLAPYYTLNFKRALETLVTAVAVGGSSVVFDELLRRFPDLLDRVGDLLAAAACFHRKTLFTRIVESAIAHGKGKRKIIRQAMVAACRTGTVDMVTQLLGGGYGRLAEEHVEEALINAAEGGNLPVVEYLTWDDKNSLVRYRMHESKLRRTLFVAAQNNHVAVLEYLLFEWKSELSAGLRAAIPKAIADAAARGAIAAMDLLLGRDRQGALLISTLDFVGDDYDLVRNVAASNCVRVLEYLLAREARQGAEFDARLVGFFLASQSNLALRWAAYHGSLNMVRFLLRVDEHGHPLFPDIDPASMDNTPLTWACMGGYLDVVQELLKCNGDGVPLYPTVQPAANNNAPLQMALDYRRTEIVSFFLEKRRDKHGSLGYRFKGMDLAVQDPSLLWKAAIHGRKEILRLFLQRDDAGLELYPEVLVPDHLLASVAQRGKIAVLELLLQYRFAGLRDQEIALALHEARAQGNTVMIALLESRRRPR